MTNKTDTFWSITPNKPLVIQLAKRQLSELVFDAVNLEGVNMTLPEVTTLLDGVTVGGHKISDQQMVINQGKAWKLLFDRVEKNTFSLSAEVACQLHAIAGKEEALNWGVFRTSPVTIAGTDYMPPAPKNLPLLFEQMVDETKQFKDIYECAFFVFLTMARSQFFFDVNKRMGRFMMNGILLDVGFPAVNVQAKKQLVFNQNMQDFYNTGEMKPMIAFLRDCLDPRIIKIMKSA